MRNGIRPRSLFHLRNNNVNIVNIKRGLGVCVCVCVVVGGLKRLCVI